VLYEGKAIAFGRREEVFARVSAAGQQVAAHGPAVAPKVARRTALLEGAAS